MKAILAAVGLALLLLALPGHSQTPRPADPPQGDVSRKVDAELNNLRRELDALTKRVEALTRTVGNLINQMVTSVQIDTLTEYFGGDQANLQPKVISTYPGNLVSAQVMLVRTEREGAGAYSNGRSVVIAPGGSALIPVEGADVLCNWVIYDEGNAIKVRSETCSYLARGLRGYFTGATYYKR